VSKQDQEPDQLIKKAKSEHAVEREELDRLINKAKGWNVAAHLEYYNLWKSG
jgi:ATP/maltotriose-dependent transcriptional regulator MalT